jgi:two-component system cell cycle sensor histidine kinase/response regulator CckA
MMSVGEKTRIALLGNADADLGKYLQILKVNGFSADVLTDRDGIADYEPDVLIFFEVKSDQAAEMARFLSGDVRFEYLPVLVVGEQSDVDEWLRSIQGRADGLLRESGRDAFLARLNLLVELAEKDKTISDMGMQLQEAQRMECIGSIAAGVVHEFNNLMFVLLGYAEISQSAPDDVVAMKECVDVSLQVAKRASSVVSSLKAMSQQVKAGGTPSDLNAVIKDALKLLKRHLEAHKVDVTTSFGELPLSTFSHGQMQQVMINLIINAVQAMEDVEGPRKLEVRTWLDGKSRIAASIRDNGKGMPEDSLDQIFKPFFTTKSNDPDRGAGGSGLGLSIVKEVVQGHGGVVQVDSEDGAGSIFKIYLPVTDEQEIELSEPGRSDDNLVATWPARILVVDDEKSNLKMIARILLKSGYDVYSVTSVGEAMAHFWSGRLDLIVMDLVMPEVDGSQCVSILRDDGIETPILICTGVIESPLIQQALDAGAQGVILKPFTSRQLLQAVHEYLPDTPREIE